MDSHFLISSKSLSNSNLMADKELISKTNYFHVYAKKNSFRSFAENTILIDGYVLPRNEEFEIYKSLDQYELVNELYSKHRKGFASHIKGFFCVCIILPNEVIIVNDIHSVKRCFIRYDSSNYYLTNNLNYINNIIHLTPFKYAPAIQAVLQHFVEGMTPYDRIEYSLPASLISVVNKPIVTNYWDVSSLINLKKDVNNQETFTNTFQNTISNYINYFNPANISATLTGGRDTRSILAALISLNIDVHNFTFGYPTGIDVITARNVSEKVNMPFSNHYISNLDQVEYDKLVSQIIEYNNPFIHIHRAHRLDAINKEEELQGSVDMVFMGNMGGDYIMGEGFNDYIITEFLRKYLTETNNESNIIKEILTKHFVKFDSSTIDFVRGFLHKFGLEHGIFNKNVEFSLVQKIIGSTHDIQDILLFMKKSKYVMVPFMDIDVMEALFSSNLSLFFNNRHTINPFNRLRGGELQCSLIKKFAPELANVNFANQYTPNDVLGNRLKYVLKRVYLQSFKIKPKPTFTYDDWFVKYAHTQFYKLDNRLDELYDLKKMKDSLQHEQHMNSEGYWHKYSNPIMLSKYYIKNK